LGVVISVFVTRCVWLCVCACVCSMPRQVQCSACRAVRQAGDCYGNYSAYINSTQQMWHTAGNIMKYEASEDRQRTWGRTMFILLKN